MLSFRTSGERVKVDPFIANTHFASMLRAPLFLFAASVLPLSAAPETPQAIAQEILAPLLSPAKVDTLKGERPVNPRLYRVL